MRKRNPASSQRTKQPMGTITTVVSVIMLKMTILQCMTRTLELYLYNLVLILVKQMSKETVQNKANHRQLLRRKRSSQFLKRSSRTCNIRIVRPTITRRDHTTSKFFSASHLTSNTLIFHQYGPVI